MNDNLSTIERFWSAVYSGDYEVVRKAIADGIDVNARIPGKVEPITLAQVTEDMEMLKLLWAAGAHPATPWLEQLFADFATGGDGTKFKRPKLEPVGKFILHHFNGDEEFALEEAIIAITQYEGEFWLTLEAKSNGTLIKSFTDSEILRGHPHASIEMPIAEAKAKRPVGTKFVLPESYDQERDIEAARFYYVEHASLENNEIEILSQQANRCLVKWTGRTTTVRYDWNEPDTAVEIEGWFIIDPPSPFSYEPK